MNRRFQRSIRFGVLLVTIGTMLISSDMASGLQAVGGKEPLQDGGWPNGVLEVINLPSRLAYSFWDSHWLDNTGGDFFFSGDTAAFQKAIDALAKVRAPAVQLVIHDGPPTHWLVKGGAINGQVGWIFTVCNPQGWHDIYNQGTFSPAELDMYRPVDPPRIDLYLTMPMPEGGVDWSKIKVPEAIRVIDDRVSSQKVHPEGGAMIRGVIYDMATGKTIAGAEIEAQPGDGKGNWQAGPKSLSDEAGQYQVEKIPAGKYRLVMSATGYAPRVINQTLELQFGMFKQLDCELSSALAINGKVVDDAEKPLKNIEVYVEGSTGIDAHQYLLPQRLKSVTDADGRFSITGMPAGNAMFRCTGTGYRQIDRNMLQTIRSWRTAINGPGNTRPTGETPVVLRMAVPGTIRAKVLNQSRYVSMSDADGGYYMGLDRSCFSQNLNGGNTTEFVNLAPGRYYVAGGFRVDLDPDAQIVTVTAGKTTEVEIGRK